MSVENSLTNEKLNDRFENPFALVNYAIGLARHRIEKGEEDQDSNLVREVLRSIARGEDLLIDDEDEEEGE